MKYFFTLFVFTILFSPFARADYDSRFSLGAGVAIFNTGNNSSTAYFEAGAEYEKRVDPMLGIGGFVNYVFSSPGFAIVGLPEGFLHPLGGEWYLSAAPIIEFGGGFNTEVGARIGTRIPLPLGAIELIPTFAVDFINGGEDYLVGIGIQF
jgi:hypothetical protein